MASLQPLPNRWLTAAFAAATVVLIAANAPASILLAAGGAAFHVEEVTGTLWRGELRGLSARGIRLGDVAFRAEPLSLLTGRFTAIVDVRGGALVGKGRLGFAPGRVAISDGRFTFDLSAAREYAILGSPLAGAVRADIKHVAWSKDGCVRGGGQIWTDVLVASAKRFHTNAFDLAGEGVCDRGNLVVALAGRGDEGAVSLAITISPTFAYTMVAEAQPSRSEVAEALQIIGFQSLNGVLTMGATGEITVVGS